LNAAVPQENTSAVFYFKLFFPVVFFGKNLEVWSDKLILLALNQSGRK